MTDRWRVCHNGNLTNGEDLRAELEARGSIFQSDTDTEVFVHLVAARTRRSPSRTAYAGTP